MNKQETTATDLLQVLRNFLQQEKMPCVPGNFFCAVSGGMDSMVLLHVMHALQLQPHVLHCNFGLRGDESDADEQLVKQTALQLGLSFSIKKFSDEEMHEAGRNIQLAARNLRYAWFELVSKSVAGKSEPRIMLAHHANDQLETLLINMARGSGLHGMAGMQQKQGIYLRPFLSVEQEALHQYAKQNSIEWRDDSSNASDKYLRNQLRHHVIPAYQQVFPGVINSASANALRLNDAAKFQAYAVDKLLRKQVKYNGAETHLPINKLKQIPGMTSVMQYFLQHTGLATATGIEAVMHLFNAQTGKRVLSESHQVVRHQEWLIISPIQHQEISITVIESENSITQNGDWTLTIKPINYKAGDPIPTNAHTAWLDADLIQFPLVLRQVKAGDYFYPLGLNKKKKISKWFIDKKINNLLRKEALVLEMDKKIVWLAGYLPDHRFRITSATRKILECTVTQKG